MRRLLTLAVLTACIGALCTVPAAALGSGGDPVGDCYAHQTLTAHYSVQSLQHGLRTMPADVREYSDCYDVLHRALAAQLAGTHGGGGGGGGAGGGSILPAPVLVILAALAVAAAGFGVVALRRRSTGDTSA